MSASVCSVSIRTVMLLRLSVGLYHGVSSARLPRLLLTLYIALYVFLQLHYYLLALYHADVPTKIDYTVLIVQIIVNVICNFIYDGENFYDFLSEIKKIDNFMDVTVTDEIPIFNIMFITIVVVKLCMVPVACVVHSIYCSWLFFISYYVPTTSVAFTNVTRIMMFESVYQRMKTLRKRLERELSYAYTFDQSDNVMVHSLRNCMMIYKKLLNTVQRSDKPMKMLILLNVAAVVPKLLVEAYRFAFAALIFDAAALPAIFHTCFDTVYPFLPGLFVELVNREVELMRLAVINQLLRCKERRGREALRDAQSYWTVRRFNYTIYRVVAVNSSLVLTTAALLTTYIVAMLQFLHFYD